MLKLAIVCRLKLQDQSFESSVLDTDLLLKHVSAVL